MKPKPPVATEFGAVSTQNLEDGPVTGRRTPVMVIEPVLNRSVKAAAGQRRRRSPESCLDEAIGLAAAIDLHVVESGLVQINAPRPATLLGSGKVAELAGQIAALGVELVIIDHPLTPVQQRNLERAWSAKVLDRTGLILEIFGHRARTKEGRLQVELAHLNYQKGRLVRSWTHLERQRGGFGFLGGPGETQIEADRRMIQERINRLEKDLQTVRRTRSLHRASRKRVPYPVVALVGYTNAGKSTLFNRLTAAEVMAEDVLFATLDPTLRQVELPHGNTIILSDTVGFISDLPTHLVAAFRATLEEVTEADLILHVRDISHEDTDIQSDDVAETLQAIDVPIDGSDRVIEIWNKIDRLDDERRSYLANTADRQSRPVCMVSAVSGEGTGSLLELIEQRLGESQTEVNFDLPSEQGALLAWLYRHTDVHERADDGDVIHLKVRVPAHRIGGFREQFADYLAPTV